MSEQKADTGWEKLPLPTTQTSPQAAPTSAPPVTAANIWEKLSPPKAPERPPTDWGHALWEGIKRGARDVLEGGAQIGARMQAAGPEEGAGAFDDPAVRAAMPERVDKAVRQSAQDYAQTPAVRAHPYVAEGGRIGGNITATAPLTAVPGLGLGGTAARTGIGLLGRGALGGGIGGAMQPVVPPQPPRGAPPQPPAAIPAGDYWTEKAKQVGLGAAVGAAIPAVGSVISPRLPSPQAVASTNWLARNFRPLYNFFTGAEERTINGFDRTIARQVLDPIGGQITGRPTGHELLRQTERQISDVYDRVLPQIQLPRTAATAADHELDDFVATMSSDHIRRFNELVDRNINNRFPDTGVMDGTTFQRARSNLARRANGWLGTNDDELGRAVLMKVDNLQEAVVRTNPPELAQPLQRANESWRLWARMRQAGSNPRKDGDFSPDDLLKAVTRQEKGRAWSGDRPLQGYAQAARAAMGRQPTSLFELAQIFHRHGILGQVASELTGPAARAAKTLTPAISPGAGGTAARELDQPRRRSSLSIAPRSEPYVGPSGM